MELSDQIWAAVLTYAAAVATPYPQPTVPGQDGTWIPVLPRHCDPVMPQWELLRLCFKITIFVYYIDKFQNIEEGEKNDTC